MYELFMRQLFFFKYKNDIKFNDLSISSANDDPIMKNRYLFWNPVFYQPFPY
jgi:hypothetical protein